MNAARRSENRNISPERCPQVSEAEPVCCLLETDSYGLHRKSRAESSSLPGQEKTESLPLVHSVKEGCRGRRTPGRAGSPLWLKCFRWVPAT